MRKTRAISIVSKPPSLQNPETRKQNQRSHEISLSLFARTLWPPFLRNELQNHEKEKRKINKEKKCFTFISLISQQEYIWEDFRTDMHRDPYGSPSKRPDVQ